MFPPPSPPERRDKSGTCPLPRDLPSRERVNTLKREGISLPLDGGQRERKRDLKALQRERCFRKKLQMPGAQRRKWTFYETINRW
jgi:hypothetical protein